MKEKLAEEEAKRKFPELEHIINSLTDVRKIWRDGFEAGWEAKEASMTDKPMHYDELKQVVYENTKTGLQSKLILDAFEKYIIALM